MAQTAPNRQIWESNLHTNGRWQDKGSATVFLQAFYDGLPGVAKAAPELADYGEPRLYLANQPSDPEKS